MDNTEISDVVNKFTDASQITEMDVISVALILFAVGVILNERNSIAIPRTPEEDER